MNGQLILLLLSLLVQGPSEQPVYPSGVGTPAFGTGQKPIPKEGYAVDQYGNYCMIIQISPELLPDFAKGDQGSEVFAKIPIDRRNELDAILFRVGTGDLPNTPPPKKLSINRANDPTMLTKLSQIDNGPNANLANASQSGNGPILPPVGGNIDPPVMPSMSANSSDRQRSLGSIGAGAPIMPNINNRSGVESLGQPQSNTSLVDDPASKLPLGFSRLTQPNTNSIPNTLSATNPTGYLNGASSQGYGPTDSNYRTNQNNSSYQNNPSNANGFPATANLTNLPFTNQAQSNQAQSNQHLPANPFGQPNIGNNQSAPFYTQPPLVAQAQNQALPPQSQSDYYGSNQYPVTRNNTTIPAVSYAGQGNASGQGTPTSPGSVNTGGDDPARTPESVLPILLLFSMVGNLYLGLWMGHLRKRYRELRSSMRGIPISELS